MSLHSRLTTPVTVTHVALAKTMVGNMHNSFDTFFLNLTAKDKSRCRKVGVAQLGTMDQIKRICMQHPRIMPSHILVTEFYSRMESIQNLEIIKNELVSLLESVNTTLTGAKDDGMGMCLDYYWALKRAAKTGVPGLRALYMEVRQNFIYTSGGKTPEELYPGVDDDDIPSDGENESAA